MKGFFLLGAEVQTAVSEKKLSLGKDCDRFPWLKSEPVDPLGRALSRHKGNDDYWMRAVRSLADWVGSGIPQTRIWTPVC